MTIFRPTITRNGVKSQSSTWSIRYRDSTGKQVQENGFLTKDEAAVRLRDSKRDAKEERAGIRTKRFKQHEKPLSEHLDDFEESLDDREISSPQKKLVSGRLQRSFDACGFTSLTNLNAIEFQAHLAKCRKKGMSQQTCKHYVRHVKQFARFLLDDDRIDVDPFRKLRPPKVIDRIHRRRALGDEDCRKLLAAARNGPISFCLSGPEREALYQTAMITGYRASELAELTPANFCLEAKIPYISLAATNTKNRDEAKIPIQDPKVIEFLKTWSADKSGDKKLWGGNWAQNRYGGKMIQRDLEAAGVAYEIDGRKADFHSLRYTFITNVIRSGEHPAVVQRMARHSDLNLTYRVYADLGLEELYHGRMPGAFAQSSAPTTNSKRRGRSKQRSATNDTPQSDEDNRPHSKSVAPNVAPLCDPERQTVTQTGTDAISEEGQKTRKNQERQSPETQQATGVDTSCRPLSQNKQAERVRFELTMPLRTCRFSRPVQSATLPPLQVLFTATVTTDLNNC